MKWEIAYASQMTNGLRDINGEYSLVGNNRAVTIAGEYLLG